jgi:hypothetical protein
VSSNQRSYCRIQRATFETVRLDFECQNVLPRLWTVSPNRMGLLARQTGFQAVWVFLTSQATTTSTPGDRAAEPAKARDISLNHVAPVESNRLLLS